MRPICAIVDTVDHKSATSTGFRGITGGKTDNTAVTAPCRTDATTVRYVDWRAFGSCTNLKNLVIEGDLSRVTNWDKDAFEGCPKSRADS